MEKHMDKLFKGTILLFIVITFAGLIALPIVQYNHKETFNGEITEKYNKRDGDSDKFYIVLDDNKVIENSDLLFKGKFDSADVQARLKVGDKVEVKTIGYRVHFLSMYPTMYEIKEDTQ